MCLFTRVGPPFVCLSFFTWNYYGGLFLLFFNFISIQTISFVMRFKFWFLDATAHSNSDFFANFSITVLVLFYLGIKLHQTDFMNFTTNA